MKLKAKVDFSSKAGDIKKGEDFKTDSAHGEFLVNMQYAEEIEQKEEPETDDNDHK